MSGPQSSDDLSPWRPEPLRLPVAAPQRRLPKPEDRKSEPDQDDRDEDLPGSHVTIIELA